MLTFASSPVCGMMEIDAFPTATRSETSSTGPFERLVSLYNDNVFLGNELDSIKAHPGFRGVTRSSIKDPSRALPRLRTLCTNSKNPRYNGRRSCEIPRCGRSQLRRRDQKPSIVLTCTSQNPSPSSSRAYSAAA